MQLGGRRRHHERERRDGGEGPRARAIPRRLPRVPQGERQLLRRRRSSARVPADHRGDEAARRGPSVLGGGATPRLRQGLHGHQAEQSLRERQAHPVRGREHRGAREGPREAPGPHRDRTGDLQRDDPADAVRGALQRGHRRAPRVRGEGRKGEGHAPRGGRDAVERAPPSLRADAQRRAAHRNGAERRGRARARREHRRQGREAPRDGRLPQGQPRLARGLRHAEGGQRHLPPPGATSTSRPWASPTTST